MGEIVDDVRPADVVWGCHRDIVLNEPGEELRHVRAVRSDRVLAHVAGLQAVQVACECGRECWWHLHRISPPAMLCWEYVCFLPRLQPRILPNLVRIIRAHLHSIEPSI